MIRVHRYTRANVKEKIYIYFFKELLNTVTQIPLRGLYVQNIKVEDF